MEYPGALNDEIIAEAKCIDGLQKKEANPWPGLEQQICNSLYHDPPDHCCYQN